MRRLIGAGHHDVLNLLVQRFDAIVYDDTSLPRVVVLRGVSGAGKSRVIREFYRRLLSRRHDEYWPHIDESGGGDALSRDPLPGRKAIGPDVDSFVWRADTLPSFAWWQFHCERMRNGDVIDVVAQARLELEAHLIPMTMAWNRGATWRQKAERQKGNAAAAVREALEEGGLEAATKVLEKFDIAVPGLGTGLSWLTKGARSVGKVRADRQLRASDVSIGANVQESRRSVAEELADLIAELSHSELPAVVAIEDLHLMDNGLSELVKHIASSRAGHPIMVVGTAWPESDDNGAYRLWRASAAAQGCLEIVNMPELTTSELVSLVRSFAPNTSDEVANAMVNRLANPLVLEATLSSKLVQRAIADRGGAVPEGAVEAVPASLDGVYRERFRELNEVIQTGLALCAVALPDHGAAVWPFMREIVAEAAAACAATREAAGDSIQSIPREGAWLTSQGGADAFREALQARVAADYGREALLLPAEQRDFRAAVIAALQNEINSQREDSCWLPGDDQALALARWYREIHAAPDDPAHIAATVLVAQRHAAAHEYQQAVALVEPIIARMTFDHPHKPLIHGDLATWLGEGGQVGEAVAHLEVLLADRMQALGRHHPGTALIRGNLAFWLGQAGRVGEALEHVMIPLIDEMRALGPDPGPAVVRGNQASWLGPSGRVHEAVAYIEVLLARMPVRGRNLGTLVARGNLACWLGRSGFADQAAEYLQILLADQKRVLGPMDALTLITRSNLATWLGEAGRADEAATRFEALLMDRMRVLRSDHPATRITRHNLATWLGEAGRVDEAVAQLEEILASWVRVRGPEDVVTLAAQRRLDYVRRFQSVPTRSMVCGRCKGTGGGSYLTNWMNCASCRGTGCVIGPVPRVQTASILA